MRRDRATEVWSLKGYVLHLIDEGYTNIHVMYYRTQQSKHGVDLGEDTKVFLLQAVEELIREDKIGIASEDTLFSWKIVFHRKKQSSPATAAP